MKCGKFINTIIVLVCLSNLVFGCLSLWYSSQPYNWFSDDVPIYGAENYVSDDIKALFGNYTQPSVPDPDVWLCVGITTMNRAPKPSYLLKTVHSLFAGLDEEERKQIHVIINNADARPDDYSDAKLLSSYLEVIAQTDTSLYYYPKQVKDYANTMRACEDKAKYTIILEDDVAATLHWVNKLAKYIPELDARDDYEYVKLFETRAFMGWENKDTETLIQIGVFSGIVAAIFFRIVLHGESYAMIKSILLSIYVGAAITLCIVAIGRQNIIPPTPGIHSLRTCCSQAHLYPQKMAKIMSEYLYSYAKPETRKWADYLVNKWADENNFELLVLYPSLFQHMGAISSVINHDRANIVSYTYRDYKR